MTPKQQRIAFQIWAYCEPRGWDCLPSEVANGIGSSRNQVTAICGMKKWTERFRGNFANRRDTTFRGFGFDDSDRDMRAHGIPQRGMAAE